MTLTWARVPIESTVLASVAYDASKSILQLEFCDGAVYRYLAVAVSIFHDLLEADSKGAYFNREIRSRFQYTVVRRRQ